MKRLINIINNLSLDGIVLTDGYNIHYLTGYKGHTGCLLVTKEKSYILTDSRYTEQVSIEAPEFECVDVGIDGYSKTVAGIISRYFDSCGYCGNRVMNIGFENNHISYAQYKAFCDEFIKNFGERVNLVELKNEINKLRMIKRKDEVENILKAESIGDKAFEHIVDYIKPGMTEKDIALELEYYMKKIGADALSFDTIVASGTNSSLPHAVPTSKSICKGDFVTLDFGCIYKGYCSDMTRTLYIGSNPDEEQVKVYNIVLKAQLEAMKYIKPGAKCSDIDLVARNIITEAGYGEFFGHGLGHSVGLFIHEEPRFSRQCDTILEDGMVLTVEPGIYLPGKFGVRIEDLILVTKDGYKNLTTSPKELICIQ